jgi:RNA polymerase sigma factor (sigma-70 family)
MATPALAAVLRHLHRISRPRTAAEPTDPQLLQQFVSRHDDEAFAALLRRHGPMVLGVCRRLLHEAHDVEDAFQATFLVLVRKAGALDHPELVGNWLYGVAYRTASEARARAASRRRHEREVSTMPPADPVAEATRRELCRVLDEELNQLPEKYRAPLVLCYLEGQTHQAAARALGVAPGSMSWRLARARELLRQRLVRRGVALSAGALALALAEEAPAALVPAALFGATLRAGIGFAAGRVLPGTASVLAESTLRAMSATRTVLTHVVPIATVLAIGAGVLAYHALPDPPAGSAPPTAAAPESAPVDLFGDLLPDGARARLGTIRWRTGHTIPSITISTDGTLLCGIDWDGALTAWEMASGKPLHRRAIPAEQRDTMTVSPDGKSAAAGGDDKDRKIRCWDVASGKTLFESAPLESAIVSLRFTADGKRLISLNQQKIRTWEVATGKMLQQMAGPPGRFGRTALSSDGTVFAVSSEDGTIQLWDLTQRELRHTLRGHVGAIYNLAFAPDGKTLASSGTEKDRTVRLWDTASGQELHRLPGARGWVQPVVFAPDGKTLATAGQDGKIHLWEAATGAERSMFRVPGQSDTAGPWVMSLAFAPDGKTLATSGNEHSVRFWDLATGKEVTSPGGHQDAISSVAFSPDGRHLVTTGNDRTIRVWDAATAREVRRVDGRENDFSCGTFSPDGSLFAAVAPGHTIRLYETSRWTELRRLDVDRGAISAIAFAPDGKTLVSGGHQAGGSLRFWEVATGKELRLLPTDPNEVKSVAISPDGKLLAAGLDISCIVLLDMATSKELRRLRWEQDYPRTLAFSPDSKMLVSSDGLGNVIRLGDVTTGRGIRSFQGHTRGVNAAALSPDGRVLASASQDNTVRLWDMCTGQELRRFTGHLGQGNLGGIASLAFSPDGRTVASAGDDTTVLLWDVTGRQEGSGLRALHLGAEELRALWDDLANADAARAYRALWALASSAQTVPFLREQLRPVTAADAQKTALLLADLDSESFEVRQKAHQELQALGEAASPALREALAAQPSAEVRRQVEMLREALQSNSPERLRSVRAVAALEALGTPEAQRLLAELAKGIPESRLTSEARASLERLAKITNTIP